METETVICCCRASTGAKLIAWIQIMGAFVGLLFSGAMASLDLSRMDHAYEGSKEGVVWAAFLLSVAIISALDLLLGALLLAGTIKEKAKLLKLWIFAEIIFSLGVLTIFAIEGWEAHDLSSLYGLAYVLYSLFALAIVGYRIYDIETAAPPVPKQIFVQQC